VQVEAGASASCLAPEHASVQRAVEGQLGSRLL
jgi:hypothetical protein